MLSQIDEAEYTRRSAAWLKTARLTPDKIQDMRRHIGSYVSLIMERRALYPHSQVKLEQRVPTGIPGCWGTSDVVIVSPQHVEIIDLKYGQGIPVDAAGNPQLRLYALGALDTFGDVLGETEVVRMTVFQPRLGSTSTEEMTADELRAWRAEILPIAEEALQPGARFGPSEKACRFCPAAGECRARVEYMTAIDFAQPADVITPEEMAALLPLISDIRAWCSAVEDTALRKAYSDGVEIPGFKVVLSGGRRGVSDQLAAVQTLIDEGFKPEQVAKFNLRPLGELEKIVGRERLTQVLGRLLERSPGKPAIVPAADKRPAVNPNAEAQKEFAA
jgi:hypothetical protein